MANNSLNVIDLDRDAQLADLRSFLRSQSVFKDYDFDGAALSVLLRLMVYNTTKGGFLTNMLFAEAFLDSGQMQSSVFSHAKDLNYIPRSVRSSSANVTVTFRATGQNQPYVIPKGSTFSTLIKNTSYIFSTPETVVASSANQTFSFTTTLYEGSYFKDAYVYQTTEDVPLPRFPITNRSADVDSLTVVVFNSGGALGEVYTRRTSLLDVASDSKVFFVQASATGGYEVLFGDGVVGTRPPDGSTVVLDYRVAAGPRANGAKVFTTNFDPTGSYAELSGGITVSVEAPSVGGADQESMDSVRYYAPRWFQARERAVSAGDYAVLLRTQFPEITAANVYGGEEADPPLYGRVLVSIAIAGLDQIPDSKVAEYTAFLKRRNSVGIKPVFISPDYTYARVVTGVKYNVSVTTETPNRIASLVSDAISTYNSSYLSDFNTTLRYSRLTEAVDSADASVVSNETSVLCYKKFYPTFLEPNAISTNFNLALETDVPGVVYPHAAGLQTVVSSSSFTHDGLTVRLEDDGLGNVAIVQDSAGLTSRVAKVGTVDYSTGIISLSNVTMTGYEGDSFRIYVRVADLDITAQRNTILLIEPAGVTINVQQVTE